MDIVTTIACPQKVHKHISLRIISIWEASAHEDAFRTSAHEDAFRTSAHEDAFRKVFRICPIIQIWNNYEYE